MRTFICKNPLLVLVVVTTCISAVFAGHRNGWYEINNDSPHADIPTGRKAPANDKLHQHTYYLTPCSVYCLWKVGYPPIAGPRDEYNTKDLNNMKIKEFCASHINASPNQAHWIERRWIPCIFDKEGICGDVRYEKHRTLNETREWVQRICDIDILKNTPNGIRKSAEYWMQKARLGIGLHSPCFRAPCEGSEVAEQMFGPDYPL